MHIREGLGLINGTSAMTGIGIINIIHAKESSGLVDTGLRDDHRDR